jgi:hypothetical protein
MCFGGGGGSPATIVMPDTRAYDRQAELQMQAMRDTQNMGLSLKQLELNRAMSAQQQVLSDFRDFKIEQADKQQFKAEETSANAARINALIGAPPPQPSAKAPVLGSDREGLVKAKGKKGLRIDRVGQAVPASQGAGTGLNIATAS